MGLLVTDSVAASLEKGCSEHYFTSRRYLDDAESEIDQARRVVVAKADETSVTEWVSVAAAHAQIAQPGASQALIRSNELLVHELWQLKSHAGVPSSASSGSRAF